MSIEILNTHEKFKCVYDRMCAIIELSTEFKTIYNLVDLMKEHYPHIKFATRPTLFNDCKKLNEIGYLDFAINYKNKGGVTHYYKNKGMQLTADTFVKVFNIEFKIQSQKESQLKSIDLAKEAKRKKLENIIEGARVYTLDNADFANKHLETAQLKRKEMNRRHVGQYMGESSLAKF